MFGFIIEEERGTTRRPVTSSHAHDGYHGGTFTTPRRPRRPRALVRLGTRRVRAHDRVASTRRRHSAPSWPRTGPGGIIRSSVTSPARR
jgi:hypothetical protein